MLKGSVIAVVIPSYRVTQHILAVLAAIGPEVDRIYVVDDACPDGSGRLVEAEAHDPRIQVVYCAVNLGVGGAVMTGYRAALADSCDILVKIDGDGQMNPALLTAFADPIAIGRADYTKGNRFFSLEGIQAMPWIRLLGNAALSFICKASSGYWSIFDPTNGYTAIGRSAASLLPMQKISSRYFFETDVLFRLGTFGAVVEDVPMQAVYGDEKSHLRVGPALLTFASGHLKNGCKRIVYNYFLRGFSAASVELVLAVLLLVVGGTYGAFKWIHSYTSGVYASSGEVMLAALPIIVGVQMLISFIGYDMQNQPRIPLARPGK